MDVNIFPDYESLSEAAASTFIDVVTGTTNPVICVASGETPVGTYRAFVKRVKNEGIDLSAVRFVGLDEWVGISADNPGSCTYFLQTHLFLPLGINAEQVHFFNATASDLDQECVKMDTVIRNIGGIDLMIVGIGLNGHIGLNEPGVSPGLYSHVIMLSDSTISSGQKYFQESTPLRKGITLGLQHVIESRKVLLLANGTKKAKIIAEAIQGPQTHDIPATQLQTHPEASAFLDETAASLLV